MKTFLEYWQIGGEQGGPKIVSVYAGRFMPFHSGHYQAFVELSKTFDQNNSFIVTADLPKKMDDSSRYPFRFNEKEFIIKTMFGIPDNKDDQGVNSYKKTSIIPKSITKSLLPFIIDLIPE